MRVQELQVEVESPSSTDSSSDSGVCLYPETPGSSLAVQFHTQSTKCLDNDPSGQPSNNAEIQHISTAETSDTKILHVTNSDTLSDLMTMRNSDDPRKHFAENLKASSVPSGSSTSAPNFITHSKISVNYLDNSLTAKDIIVSLPSPHQREQNGRFRVKKEEIIPLKSDTFCPLNYDASESDISQSIEITSDIVIPPVKKKHSVTFAQIECDIREFVPDKGEIEESHPEMKKFTEEYLGLQEQLKKMKEVCDKLKQTNLRHDMEELQHTMKKFENSSVTHNMSHLRERYKTISKMISEAQR